MVSYHVIPAYLADILPGILIFHNPQQGVVEDYEIKWVIFLASFRGIPAESYRAGRSGFPDFIAYQVKGTSSGQ
jgi:hypothetical protein